MRLFGEIIEAAALVVLALVGIFGGAKAFAEEAATKADAPAADAKADAPAADAKADAPAADAKADAKADAPADAPKAPHSILISDGTDEGSYFGAVVNINSITTVKVPNEGTIFNSNNSFIFVPATSDVAHVVHDFKNGNLLKPMECDGETCTQDVFVTGVGKLHVVTISTVFGVQIVSPTEEVYDIVHTKLSKNKKGFVIKYLVLSRD